jgi:dihydroneopterin aldolase
LLMVENMPSDHVPGMRWRVFVKDMETTVRIGIHDHEKEAQKLWVNARIEGVYPVFARQIGDCFNYDLIHQLVVGQWPKRDHVQLLETLAVDLLQHVFSHDERVDYVRVSIAKPDVFKEARAVGVEAEWKRDDYKRFHMS